jgi:hypothetical protein
MVIRPYMRAYIMPYPSTETKTTMIYPTARLLKLYEFVAGQKLALTPTLVIEVDNRYVPHWQTLHQILQLWMEGIYSEFLSVHIQKAANFVDNVSPLPGESKGYGWEEALGVIRTNKRLKLIMSSSSWRKLPWPWKDKYGAGIPTVGSSFEHALLGPLRMSAALEIGQQLKLYVMMPPKGRA